MIKALLIGCGKIAGGSEDQRITHGGVYRSMKGVELVACLDKDINVSRKYASKYNCSVEIDLEKALNIYTPDVVSVCTPDHTHFEITQSILLSSKPPKVVFLEKPACSTEIELKKLISLSKSKQIDIVVNHSRRFDVHHNALRKKIIDGEFGILREIHATYYGGWQHNGVHLVDTLSYLFDSNIEVLSINNILPTLNQNDPTLELSAKFQSVQGRLLFFGFNEQDYQMFDLDIRFDRYRLRIENFGERILLEKQVVNDIHEKVLVLEQNRLSTKNLTSMEVAINTICNRLEKGDSTLLDGVRLGDIAPTMYTIWQGVNLNV